ncbi:hypothetical protein GCM10011534_24410 [Pseudooceanicola nanhaiensis]|jgi:hypothetical protein|uniref:Copper chaperone PCu(A)C n=1 Tax=Pseudooceanicola nanhaiensis TaxID=375761 RepID=A0A917WGB3_9RHOB|nr:hypothetical protein [Pseudooceanicola nanhaiensis]GGM01706.1 hypothetical protein GCM10011534_24410 [Pseudooceanicola nanhaiensis]
MKNTLFMLLIGLFFGTGLGFLLAQAPGATMSEGHDHAAHGVPHGDADMAGHDHSALLEAGAGLRVMLQATPEGNGGVNLHIVTENFRFAPEHVNGAPVPGEGHAHVYVDGVKVLRSYGPYAHVSGITPGETEIRVTLNANSHEQLAIDGTPVEAVQRVTVE